MVPVFESFKKKTMQGILDFTSEEIEE